MTPNRRARVAGLVATAASIPFMVAGPAGANASTGTTNSLDKIPTASECSGYLWTDGTTALSASHPRIVIPGLTKPAGTINVTEAITGDTRLDQAVESYEKMRVEYWKGDTMLAATSAFTPDLVDNDDLFSWAVTPLGQVDIFEEADRVELVHASQWMKTDGAPNAFYPISVCFTWAPLYTDASITPAIDCEEAVLTIRNDGNAKLNINVTFNGQSYDYQVPPYGGSYDKHIPLTEDESMTVVVTDSDTGEKLWSKTWTTDCVQPTTTTTEKPKPETPTTTVPTEVLGVVVDQPVPPAQVVPVETTLPRTGSQSTTNAAVGGSLLAMGAAMLGFSRRKRVQA